MAAKNICAICKEKLQLNEKDALYYCIKCANKQESRTKASETNPRF